MPKRPPTHRYGDTYRAAQARSRPQLNRDRIVAAAIDILDSDGPDALTFRRLAEDLDAGVGTLYWHVKNKDAVLQLALDRVVGEIRAGFDAHPRRTWDKRLRAGFVELWRLLRRHPWAAHFAMSSVERGPNMLRYWDRGATLLFDSGFEPTEVFDGLTALFTYTIGSGMVNAAWHTYGGENERMRRETLAQATDFFASLDPDAYPSFQRLNPVLAGHDEDDQFLAGLDLLIVGLRGRLGAPT